MDRIIGCVRDHHDPRLVVLAAIVCLVSSFGSIKVWWLGFDAPASSRRRWLLFAGSASGFGVWATHFIAMTAYLPGIPVTYDLTLVFTSLIIAVTLFSAGLSVTETERTPGSWLAGGVIIGLAIAAMHYLGVQSMSLAGRVGWSPDLVVASLVISIGATSAALRAASGNRSSGNLVLAAILFAFAVTGLHFTAMTALVVIPDPRRIASGNSLTGREVGLVVSGVAAVLLAVGSCSILRDRRLERTRP